jgi:hypothetical protein
MIDKDFVNLTERMCRFEKPGNTTKRDVFLWAGAELLESKYTLTCFYEMYTSENALLKHGIRLATDVIFSLLEKGRVT